MSLIRALTVLVPAAANEVEAEAVAESATSQVPLLLKSKLYLYPAAVSAAGRVGLVAKLTVTVAFVLHRAVVGQGGRRGHVGDRHDRRVGAAGAAPSVTFRVTV